MEKIEQNKYQRVNITLPKKTLNLIDRLTEKGDRSHFLDQAVHFFVKEKSKKSLKSLLRDGAVQRYARDLQIAEEWFPVVNDTELVWHKKKK